MKKDKQKETVEYWTEIVQFYFSFCRSKFGENPTFDCSSPRDLRTIVLAIKKKAEDKQMIWSLELALKSLNVFFETAYRDKWLKDNFVLLHMNRNKDKIFYRIAEAKQQQVTNKYQTEIEEKLKNYKPSEYER